jgi:hypothetical protein
MSKATDFRQSSFDTSGIMKSGKYIGRGTYWKLYAIENIFRIVIHSVLSVQIPKPDNWWDVAVDATIKQKAEKFKISYLKKAWHGKPGAHDIYYIDLKDLNEIVRANANLFDPVIPDLDRWMLGIEDLRLPRNVVAHMNFPTDTDIKRIDVFYEDCLKLVPLVQTKVPLIIP